MHHALGNTLAILVRQLFEQLVVLQQHRAARTCRLDILVIGNRRARARGHAWLVDHGDPLDNSNVAVF
ncbi:hypothetical protein D9M69_731490 [compost metagenome]